MRLFSPDDLTTTEELSADAAAALTPGEVPRTLDLDAAKMFLSRDDGLLVRGVKPHSAEKSKLVGRSLDTVATAMKRQWWAREHGLEYVELYAGPGRLVDSSTGVESSGSPLNALEIGSSFTKFIFCDYSPECVDALSDRVGDRKDVTILRGDANDLGHLRRVGALLNRKALVIAYLDPARPKDLCWSTIRFLAEQFKFLDLIINLPLNSLYRAARGAHGGGGKGPGVAGKFLNHPRPIELVSGPYPVAVNALRAHYDAQLRALGFLAPARRTVNFPENSPYYDILLASRHPRAIELWNQSNPVEKDAQMALIPGGPAER